jgi:hypothetical protein
LVLPNNQFSTHSFVTSYLILSYLILSDFNSHRAVLHSSRHGITTQKEKDKIREGKGREGREREEKGRYEKRRERRRMGKEMQFSSSYYATLSSSTALYLYIFRPKQHLSALFETVSTVPETYLYSDCR